jgi:hypothetical protein
MYLRTGKRKPVATFFRKLFQTMRLIKRNLHIAKTVYYNSLSLLHTVDIPVDLQCPESNNGFQIYDLGQTCEGVGDNKHNFFFGFAIFRKMDIRHILSDPKKKFYKCRISGSNELLITEPAWDFDHLHNRDCLSKKIPANCLDAVDDAHDKYNKGVHGRKEQREWTHYRLRFPGVEQLSSSTIFAEASEDEWCELKIIPVTFTETRLSPYPITHHYAMWTVVRLDLASRKKGKLENADDGVSDAAKMLQSLGINFDGAKY